MKITIASGKGGTGKTTVAANLAWVLSRPGVSIDGRSPGPVRLLDCDVEEPNDHLFVRPDFQKRIPVHVPRPVWIEDRCTGCGKCAAACRFNAMAVVKGKVLVFPELCHACGVCTWVCPEDALVEEPSAIGEVRIGKSAWGFDFVDGVLNPGEALAPVVVRAVKRYAGREGVTLLDAAPGAACPVVEAMTGADVILLVTEPTPFGLHDLSLAAALALEIGVPTGIVVNRSDGADDLIRDYSERTGIPIVGRIPFRRDFAETYSGGGLPAERFPDVVGLFLDLFRNLWKLAGTTPPPPERARAAIETVEISTGDEQASAPSTAPADGAAREVTIISGKGGTGKTTVAAALTRLLDNKVLADCDVDAADLHLLTRPRIIESHPFTGGAEARITAEQCISCGQCAAACHFEAIHPGRTPGARQRPAFEVDPLACEGCGLCQLVCPVGAVEMVSEQQGEWYVSVTDYGPMVHARLGIGQENSGKLVGIVRDRAAAEALRTGRRIICADGPPGTGCPVISSISGTDLVLIVTEPTVSGVHDMERVLQLAAHFRVPALVVINKADLNREQSAHIERIAGEQGAPVIAHIPFDPGIVEALKNGESIVDFAPDSDTVRVIREVKDRIETALFAETSG